MAATNEPGSATDQGLRDAPWLRPVSVELVAVEPTFVAPGTADAGLGGPVYVPPVPLGVPTGELLPEWWLEELRDQQPERFDELESLALQEDAGDFVPFQQASRATLGHRDLPGTETREIAERQALDPSQRDRVVDSDGLLDAVVGLVDAEPEAYRQVASQYGLLRLCGRHGVPLRRCEMGRSRGCKRLVLEPLLYWCYCSHQIAAILRLARQLDEEEVEETTNRDWALVAGRQPGKVAQWRETWGDRAEISWEPRIDLARAVEWWLRYGDVRLHLLWRPSREPELADTGVGLIGGLAKQLAYTVAGAERRVLCAECGMPFVPAERPQPGKRAFCPRHRRAKAPQKHAQRDYRARNRRLVAIVEDELGGVPNQEDESAKHAFWERVQRIWRREGHPERTLEQLRATYERKRS